MPCGAGAGSGGGAVTGGGGRVLRQVGVGGGVLRQVGVGGRSATGGGGGERCEEIQRHCTSSCNIIVKYSYYSIVTIHEIICVCTY